MLGLSSVLGGAGVAHADEPRVDACGIVYQDPIGDASIRRTDPGCDGPLAGETPPDLLGLRITGWQPKHPSDPFTGVISDGERSGIVRIDLTFAGHVSPPGRIDPAGVAHNPAPFGGTPVFGFVEIDVDRDKDTGGELGPAARNRLLACMGRFGVLPEGGRRDRAARHDRHLDQQFSTPPQYERSGADFSVSFCGCELPKFSIVSGNSDHVFDPDEVWWLQGRFFQRSGGYRDASGVWGGSDFGHYDPYVLMQVAHSSLLKQTTFSIVFPLSPTGAAFLTDEPVQPIDQTIDYGSHSSVQEALQDLIWSAQLSGLYTEPVRTLIERWKGKKSKDFLDPSEWRAVALFGMSYRKPDPARFAWTDIGFGFGPMGDGNNDGVTDEEDRERFLTRLATLDGSSNDADGSVNGTVVIPNFGPGFHIMDFNADGVIDAADLVVFPSACAPDFNGDTVVDVADLFAYINAWLAKENADFNDDDAIDVADLFAYINAWLAKC